MSMLHHRGSDAGVDDFLQKFLRSFDGAAGSDSNFEKSRSTLMTSMLSNVSANENSSANAKPKTGEPLELGLGSVAV